MSRYTVDWITAFLADMDVQERQCSELCNTRAQFTTPPDGQTGPQRVSGRGTIFAGYESQQTNPPQFHPRGNAMTIHPPLCITSRLQAGVRLCDGSEISLRHSAVPGDFGRDRYQWTIDAGGQKFSGNDLQSGCQGGSLQEGMESLLSFLGAFADAYGHEGSENADLFPPELGEWAQAHSEELAMLVIELEEQPGQVIVE